MLSEVCHFAESDLLTKFGTHPDTCPVLEQVVWPQCTSLIFFKCFRINIAKIANAVQVTICLLVSTSVY